jgi:hypothetical protein
MQRIKIILLFVFLLIIIPNKLIAQRATGFEMEGGIRASDLEPVSLYSSGKYAWWFNPYVAYTAGGGFSYTNFKASFNLPEHPTRYYIDDKIMNLFGVTGLKFATPVLGNIGLMTDADFQFSPIPFNFVSIESSAPNSDFRNYRNRFVYTRFNPSYNIQISAFYNLRNRYDKNDRSARLAIGLGFGNHNPLNTYYRVVIDDIHLRDHLKLKPEKMNFSVFVRVSNI